jgi:hypothetical protein
MIPSTPSWAFSSPYLDSDAAEVVLTGFFEDGAGSGTIVRTGGIGVLSPEVEDRSQPDVGS